MVSKVPEPKNDENGRQKADRVTGELLFVTELVAMDDDGAEVIKVTTGGAAPKVGKRQMVTVTGLRVAHWAMEGRSGLTFRADSITSVQVAGAGAGFGRAPSDGGRRWPRATSTRAQAAYDAAELAFDDASEAERAAFERWQAALGAFERAGTESGRAWRARTGPRSAG